MKVLYLIPRLEHGGAAKQLSLLAAGLPRDRFEVCVCALGRDGPFAGPLRQAGVRVVTLGWHRVFDLAVFRQLARLVQDYQPDVIHAWRPTAVRVAGLLPVRCGRRLIVSAPFERKPRPGIVDRWLLRRVEKVAVFSSREAEACRGAGVPEARIACLPPGVSVESAPAAVLAVPADVHCIACVGPLELDKGFRDAVWAFDILRHVREDVHLLIIGGGPDRPRVQKFVHDIQADHLVHLLGPRDDVPALLARSSVVWVPSRAAGGVNAALEGQAAGRPVLASHLPELREVIADGQTGLLAPPGTQPVRVRQTRRLLEEPERLRAMGDAARRHVQQCFPVAELVRRCAALYDSGG